jgi:predicted dehydrogenase
MVASPDARNVTRRAFLRRGGSLAAGAAVLAGALPAVHAAGEHTIRLALIGCGGRGNGAVGNALKTSNQGPIRLHAVADVDAGALERSIDTLSEQYADRIDVPRERQFVGFDAYRRAIDVLRPGDVAMCTTRSYIRPLHVEYAVAKGINVFMEKLRL